MPKNNVDVVLYPYLDNRNFHGWELLHRPDHGLFNVVVRIVNNGAGGEAVSTYIQEEGEECEVVTDEVYDARVEQVMANCTVDPMDPQSEPLNPVQADTFLFGLGVRMDHYLQGVYGWGVLSLIPDMLARWEAVKLLLTPATPL